MYDAPQVAGSQYRALPLEEAIAKRKHLQSCSPQPQIMDSQTTALHHLPTKLTSGHVASILFGSHLYQRYITWQKAIDGPNEAQYYSSAEAWVAVRAATRVLVYGALPSPAIYKVFMTRIRSESYPRAVQTKTFEQSSQRTNADTTLLLVARLCGHTLHPGHPGPAHEVCLICAMHQCVAALKRIANAWGSLGGPTSRPRGGFLQEQLYFTVKRIWHAEKTRWANLVSESIKSAAVEVRWEEQCRQGGFEVLNAVEEAMSSAKALEVGRQSPFMVDGWEEQFVPTESGTDAREILEPTGLDVCLTAELPNSPPYPTEGNEDVHLSKNPHMSHSADVDVEPNESDYEGANNPSTADDTKGPSISPYGSSPSVSSSQSTSMYAPSPPPLPIDSPLSSAYKETTWAKRRVRFANDTKDCATHRLGSFQRTHPRYVRGTYSPPPDSVWADTSFMYDRSYDEHEDVLHGPSYETSRDGSDPENDEFEQGNEDTESDEDEDDEDSEDDEEIFEYGNVRLQQLEHVVHNILAQSNASMASEYTHQASGSHLPQPPRDAGPGPDANNPEYTSDDAFASAIEQPPSLAPDAEHDRAVTTAECDDRTTPQLSTQRPSTLDGSASLSPQSSETQAIPGTAPGGSANHSVLGRRFHDDFSEDEMSDDEREVKRNRS